MARPRKGYRVFAVFFDGQRRGLLYNWPESWGKVVRRGAVHRADYLDNRTYVECGEGINVWRTWRDAVAWLPTEFPTVGLRRYEIWEVEPTPDAIVTQPTVWHGGLSRKWRTDGVRYLRRVGVWNKYERFQDLRKEKKNCP